MASAASAASRAISQQAFEDLVAENISDLGMDPDEAIEDAIQTLNLQGVDLAGIIKRVPGANDVEEHPLRQCLDGLKKMVAGLESSEVLDLEKMVALLDNLSELCCVGGSENASIAARNGGVELLVSICGVLSAGRESALASALRALRALLHDVQSTETFRRGDGPKIIMDILNKSNRNSNLLDCGFAVVAAAATGNEIVKEAFVEHKIDELFLVILTEHPKGSVQSLYAAMRVLLTPDDNRVVASQVYGYARMFAKIGIADALVDSIREGISSSSLVSACIALKAVAVNDEICRSISENGGIDVILQCIDESSEQNDKVVAKTCCSLLSKLAGSDSNKTDIVRKGGLDRLIKLSLRFSDDPPVLQEVMSIISVLSLRSRENAGRAVEAGAGDLAIRAMQKFPAAYLMQRQSCHMIRNLVARNPENRAIFLSRGIEKIIRRAKASHESCRDAATAALRDLGLDDYNK